MFRSTHTSLWEDLQAQLNYQPGDQQLVPVALRYLLQCLCKQDSAKITDWIVKTDDELQGDFWNNVKTLGPAALADEEDVVYGFFEFVFISIRSEFQPSDNRYDLKNHLGWNFTRFCTSLGHVAFRLPCEEVESIIRWPLLKPGTESDGIKVIRSLRNTPLGLQEGLIIPVSRVSVVIMQQFREILHYYALTFYMDAKVFAMSLCTIVLSITPAVRFSPLRRAWLDIWSEEHRNNIVDWQCRATSPGEKLLATAALCAADGLQGRRSQNPHDFFRKLVSHIDRARYMRDRVSRDPLVLAKGMLLMPKYAEDASVRSEFNLQREILLSRKGTKNSRKQTENNDEHTRKPRKMRGKLIPLNVLPMPARDSRNMHRLNSS